MDSPSAKLTNADKKQLKAAVSSDNIRFRADGSVEFKRAYFYRHGVTAESWTDGVVAQVEAAGFTVESRVSFDMFKHWPKTSYFTCALFVVKK
jgi:hypothetical protein